MPPDSDKYRQLAAHFEARAQQTGNAQTRAEWEKLSRAYSRLAEQSERNDALRSPLNTKSGDDPGKSG